MKKKPSGCPVILQKGILFLTQGEVKQVKGLLVGIHILSRFLYPSIKASFALLTPFFIKRTVCKDSPFFIKGTDCIDNLKKTLFRSWPMALLSLLREEFAISRAYKWDCKKGRFLSLAKNSPFGIFFGEYSAFIDFFLVFKCLNVENVRHDCDWPPLLLLLAIF